MSAEMSAGSHNAGLRLNRLLVEAGMEPLDTILAGRFEEQLSLIIRWNARINLTANRDEEGILRRHFIESITCARALPAGIATLLDVGSGAGFPGMVIAILLADVDGARVDCIDSDRRKCAFLREVARATGAPAEIHADRIEVIAPDSLPPVDAVVARAFAPLPRLLELAKVWIMRGAVGVFPRGRSAETQLEALPAAPDLTIDILASKLDPEAAILRARSRLKARS